MACQCGANNCNNDASSQEKINNRLQSFIDAIKMYPPGSVWKGSNGSIYIIKDFTISKRGMDMNIVSATDVEGIFSFNVINLEALQNDFLVKLISPGNATYSY